MQRNRSAHTAWFLLVAWKILDFSHFKEKDSRAELLELADWFSTFETAKFWQMILCREEKGEKNVSNIIMISVRSTR